MPFGLIYTAKFEGLPDPQKRAGWIVKPDANGFTALISSQATGKDRDEKDK